MPLSDFARRHLDGALNHDGAAKEIADAIDSGGGGGVTLPVTVAQDDFNNTKLIGTAMPNLVGDLDGFTGYDNIAIGLESYDNFGAGLPYTPDPTHYALAAVTTGAGNVAIGPSALMALTEGTTNTAIGDSAGFGLTTGGDNVFIGAYTGGGSGMTGSSNVLIGSNAGAAITSGFGNLCVGASAGQGITTGSGNLCVGGSAGVGLAQLTTGLDNTFVGQSAGPVAADTTGAVAIGRNSVAASGQCAIGTGTSGAYPLALGFAGATAPADADIQNGMGFFYWDSSASGLVLKYKGKAADGTVVSKTVSTV